MDQVVPSVLGSGSHQHQRSSPDRCIHKRSGRGQPAQHTRRILKFLIHVKHHFLSGLRNSPNGDRLAGGARAVCANAPRIGGSWASFWGVWCVFENAIFFARRKEDPWNSVAGGAATSGFFKLRRGARVAARSSLVSGAVIALCEGFCIFLDKHVIARPAPTVEFPPAVEQVSARPAPTVDRLGRPLVPTAPEVHVPKPRGFLGIPPRAPIVVKEVPASDLGY